MKTIKMKSALSAFAICFCLWLISAPDKSFAQLGVSISFQVFYDDLSPYGNWINDDQYGYVWQPGLGNDFRPYYSDGYWVMTTYGSTWVSNYSWGWAPFHYGRWVYDPFYGWVWIPGREWGPAWVNWRQGGGYYGWTPLGPGYGPGEWWNYNPPYNQWIFVNQGYVFDQGWHNHYYGPHVENIFTNTTVVQNTYINNNTTYITGPRVSEIEKETKIKVPVYKVNNNTKPGKSEVQGNAVTLYRPAVTASGNTPGEKPAPKKFENAKQPIVQPKQNGNVNGNKTAPDKVSPKQTTPNKTAPNPNVKTAPNKNSSNQTTPKQGAPNQTAPKQSVTPKQGAPNQTTPKQSVTPKQNNPQPNPVAPKQTAPQKQNNNVPKQEAPKQNVNPEPKQNQQGTMNNQTTQQQVPNNPPPKQMAPQQKQQQPQQQQQQQQQQAPPPKMNNQPKQNQQPKMQGGNQHGNKKDKPK